MYKVCIIGVGIISEKHINAIKMLNDKVELTAVCDILLERANDFCLKYGGTPYSDYKEMLDNEELDIAVICLPHGLHKEATIHCANKKVHILLEKPMANSVEECSEMIKACKENDVCLMIGHIQRYFAHNIKVKELINSGELGDLVMSTDVRTINYFTPNRPKWFLDKKLSGGGIVMNYGAHSFDKLLWITDRKIKKISSFTMQHIKDIEVEGNAQILVELEGNVSSSISFVGYRVPSIFENYYYLTDGAIKVDEKLRVFVSCRGEEFIEVAIDKKNDSFYLMWNDFLSSIKNGTPPEIDGEYGLQIIRAIELSYNKI